MKIKKTNAIVKTNLIVLSKRERSLPGGESVAESLARHILLVRET